MVTNACRLYSYESSFSEAVTLNLLLDDQQP